MASYKRLNPEDVHFYNAAAGSEDPAPVQELVMVSELQIDNTYYVFVLIHWFSIWMTGSHLNKTCIKLAVPKT